MRKPVSTIHGTRTERTATANDHARGSAWRPSRYAGNAALAITTAFRTWPARNASGGESVPKSGARSSG
jgi:hypothetical protein